MRKSVFTTVLLLILRLTLRYQSYGKNTKRIKTALRKNRHLSFTACLPVLRAWLSKAATVPFQKLSIR